MSDSVEKLESGGGTLGGGDAPAATWALSAFRLTGR